MLRIKNLKKPKEAGQAAVEFALALLIFLPILFAILDFGWISFQKGAFEYAYMHASWEVSAGALGDSDALEDDPSIATYGGPAVSGPLYDEMSKDSATIIATNLNISGASAKLYNKTETYSVPSSLGNSVPAISRTRYMDLSAELVYTIRPLTPIGSAIFGPSLTVYKELDRTRVVASQHRSE
ncbi:TadE-like protein [Sporobacter termitidis DSM 10068]|uniref:TadE-like protein n=1 Tax=Sporobacter termitidis DSM 10068 TaxID=1123282 RepID=A0A1M5Z474_9FIRM|nr:TadE family protein [Sporobacter termitidis]SHI18918.1 TadE-like protein [Sporobacter termitidis DSM 10068]